jgi:hypothetical protein
MNAVKAFPYKAICVVGITCLVSSFKAGLHPTTGEIIILPLLLYLFAALLVYLFKIIANLGSPRDRKFKIAIGGFLLCLAILCVTFPIGRLGEDVKLQLFLRNFDRYQRLVDILVKKEQSHFPIAFARANVPDGYSDLCPYWVWVSCDENHVVTVEFLMDDYGFPPRHGGYIYRSNDEIHSLRKIVQYSDLGFYRIAPNWYEWSD